MITFWEDCTEEAEAEKETQRADLVLKDQEFQNYVSLGDYKRAVLLALSLGQPGRLLSLFQKVISSRSDSDTDSESGVQLLDRIIKSLDGTDIVKLLSYVRDWNTQAKTSAVAQTILYAIVKLRSADSMMQSFKDSAVEKRIVDDADADEAVISTKPAANGETALKEMVEAIIPYAQRHLSRMDRLLQESYVVDYILGEMDNGMFDAEFSDGEEGDGMDVDKL